MSASEWQQSKGLDYAVSVRGEIPADLVESVSRAHVKALQQARKNIQAHGKADEKQPPNEDWHEPR